MKKTRPRTAPALVGVIASLIVLEAGPALGARINNCTTISKPGFYELTRNLTATGDCLVVAANNVTLDLGGWVITGPGDGAIGITAQLEFRSGIAVRNGTVTGFEAGIGLANTAFAVVEKVRAVGNTFGIVVGDRSILRDNIASGDQFGLEAGSFSIVSGNIVGADIGLSVGPGSTVSGNISSGDDPSIVAGPGSTVDGNTVAGSNGIVARAGSTVSGNTAHAEVGDNGLQVSCPSNVIGNTATGYTNNLVLSGAGCTNIDNLAP